MSYWTPLRSFRHPWGPQNGPKHHPNGPRGTWRAQRVQIWSQLPPIGLTGLESWLPDTLTRYLASSGPPGPQKRPFFGPKRLFWGLQRDLEGPEGPALVPTAANWYDWAGIMVNRHIDLVSGLFWAPRAPKRARFGPKRVILKIVTNLSCDLSKFAQEDHSANGENITMIRCTS